MMAHRAVLAAALTFALLLPGCTFLRGEGDEQLIVKNATAQPVNVILIIEQRETGIRIFGENIRLQPGAERTYALAMRPGLHDVAITTSTSIQEFFEVDIPTHGDTTLDLSITRSGATFSTRST